MPSGSVIFDRAAEYYDETRGFPPGVEQQVAALICRAGSLTGRSRVLEVGVGTGRIALPLAQRVRLVAGIDLARPMLQRLRAKQTTEPVCVVEGDAVVLPFAPGMFDAAVAVHVFHLIAGWRDALREVARVLRPGGVLLSGQRDHEQPQHEPHPWLWETWDRAVWTDGVPNVGVPREQYATFLEDAGWQPVGEKAVYTFGVTQTLRQFISRMERRVWSSLWRVPDDVIQNGVAALWAAVAERGLDPDAPFETESNFAVRAYRPPEG